MEPGVAMQHYLKIIWVSDGVYLSVSVYIDTIVPFLLCTSACTAHIEGTPLRYTAKLSNYINLSHTFGCFTTSSLLNTLSLPNNPLWQKILKCLRGRKPVGFYKTRIKYYRKYPDWDWLHPYFQQCKAGVTPV